MSDKSVRKITALFHRYSYFFIKIIRALVTALIIMVISFFMIRSSGNPALIYLGTEATPEALEYFNHKWGLDRPVIHQFSSYFGRLMHGKLGNSLIKSRPVGEIIGSRLGATLSLMIPAAVLSIGGGIILGTIAALRHKKPLDGTILVVSTLGFSLPNFFFGVLLIFLFSVVLGWLPSSGNEGFRHYLMPLTAIVTADCAIFTRFTRAALVDIFDSHFIASFRSLGIKERRIFFLQALPNAAISLLTISGFYIGSLVSGAIITETVFSWPGLGSLLVESLRARDYPIVQALMLLFGFSIVVTNLIIDVLYGVADPRIRKGAEE